jgi:hypothetical protein
VPAPHELKPPPPWNNGPLTLFHGTTLTHWLEIQRGGVRVNRGRSGTDFGPGFYATADREQAVQWAISNGRRFKEPPVVIWAEMSGDRLASLECLCFVRGHEGARDFWSFVLHCRAGANTHARAAPSKPMYAVVAGPVSRNFKRRAAYENMDQISFHTEDARAVLNQVPWSGHDPTR